MSKKKNKFKKNKKHHAAPQHAVRETRPAVSEAAASPIEEKEEAPIESSPAATDPYAAVGYEYVSRDIKKILIIMGSIIILLIIFYILDIKTSVFDTIGNWLYKILNIQNL